MVEVPFLGVLETRRIFGGETGAAKAIFYLLALLAIAVFFVGILKRLRAYSKGRRPEGWKWLRAKGEFDVAEVTERPAASETLMKIAANTTVASQKRRVGIAHLLLFWGFIGLLLATTILSVDYDIVGNVSRIFTGHTTSFFQGTFYLAYNAIFNAAGLAALVGVLMLALRRWMSKEPQLDYTRAEVPEGGYSRLKIVIGDQIFLVGLIVLILTGILIQGLRIEGAGFPAFEKWTWLGWLSGKGLAYIGVSAASAKSIHGWLWWVHVALALVFVAYLPWSKALHMLSSPANLLVSDPANTRRLPPPPAGKAGYLDLGDFTPKELLAFDSCTKCGRCHHVCPARTAGGPLSPRDFILDLRQWCDRENGVSLIFDGEARPVSTGPLSDGPIAGGVVAASTLWSCTTCMACVDICPVGIEHVPSIVQLRRSLVDSGELEQTLQDALQNIATQGNSFGKSSRTRARWTKGLDFEIPDARKEHVEYLWFLGDFASFDERLMDVSRTLAQVLHSAGMSFGILYEDERNAGNDVRRVGEEGLFEMLVESNLEVFSRASFDKIFTTDPHSLNTLRNEYPIYGLDKEVRHYSEVLAEMLLSSRVDVRPLGKRVTYHDPCYLGRYNRVLDAPRVVLAGLGCELVEMPRHGTNSFCCGAGGGRIWMDDSSLAERPSMNRIREALGVGVDYFVVACPKDFAMFTDAVKTVGSEGVLQVVDLVELFAEALTVRPLVGA